LTVPEKLGSITAIDGAVLPMLQLHRLLSVAQPPEEQLEVSEVNLLTFGVDKSMLQEAGYRLDCQLLQEPQGLPLPRGVIIGLKKKVVVVRTVKIRGVSRSVAFIVDTGAPVTFIAVETLNAFGIGLEQLTCTFVQGSILTDTGRSVLLEVQIFAPDGPHNDLNILGMDYMLECNAQLHMQREQQAVAFVTE
jgi:hypothetical protein